MAHVTGPISTLPGATHALAAGAMCDDHPDRPAVARLQGETDSMGSEMIDCCAECHDAISAARRAPRTGPCDWCRTPSADLRDRRDVEEGASGRVYQVCASCRAQDDERHDAEVDDFFTGDDFDDCIGCARSDDLCCADPDWDDAEDGFEREYDEADEECPEED